MSFLLGDYLAQWQKKTPEAQALETFHMLDRMGPEKLPPLPYFPKAVFERWREGGVIEDKYKADFAIYLVAQQKRAAAVSENERRLRATEWAQRVLAGTEYGEILSNFHREMWGIQGWSADSAIRDEQIRDRVRYGVC